MAFANSNWQLYITRLAAKRGETDLQAVSAAEARRILTKLAEARGR